MQLNIYYFTDYLRKIWKKILHLYLFSAAWATAQTGNVGINTTSPQAALEVVNKTAGTKYMRILNSANTEFMTVNDIANQNTIGMGINRTAPALPLDIFVPAAPQTGMTFRISNGTSYVGHAFNSREDANYDQRCVNTLNRDQGIYFSIDNDTEGGLFIGPRSDKSTGFFIGENGLNAVYGNCQTPVLPRATLDVQGSLMLAYQPTLAAPCEMVFLI